MHAIGHMDKNKSLEKTQQQMKLCSCVKFDNIDAIDHMDEIDYTN
jgi:hypothetical protein